MISDNKEAGGGGARGGGGGPAAAAGCTVSGTLAEAEAAILDAIRQVEAGA